MKFNKNWVQENGILELGRERNSPHTSLPEEEARMSPFQTILVPHDGSALADTALPYAVELTRATGATLELLRVLEELKPIYDRAGRQLIWIDPDDPRAELTSPDMLGTAASMLPKRGLTPRRSSGLVIRARRSSPKQRRLPSR